MAEVRDLMRTDETASRTYLHNLLAGPEKTMLTIGKRSKIIILPQPVDLGGQVPVEDITFGVLETPRNYNQDVSFANPGALFDLALDPAHPLNTIVASDTNMVCTHHQFGTGKLFVQFLFGEPDTDNRCPVRIKLRYAIRTVRFFYVIINTNISGGL